jgi:hypothetical protein
MSMYFVELEKNVDQFNVREGALVRKDDTTIFTSLITMWA